MAIETLEDWNERLAQCGCCSMPSCPEPSMVCESVWLEIAALGRFADEDGIPHSKKITTSNGAETDSSTSDLYTAGGGLGVPILGPDYTDYSLTVTDSRTKTEESSIFRVAKCSTLTPAVTTVTLDGSYSRTTTQTGGYADVVGGMPSYLTNVDQEDVTTIAVVAGAWERNESITTTDPTSDSPWTFGAPVTVNTGPFTSGVGFIGETYTYEDPIALDAARTEFTSEIAALSFTECPESNGASCASSYTESTIPIEGYGDFVEVVSGEKARYRWQIPDTFEGSYFKVTWDVIEEPDGWDAEPPTATRSFHLEDETWTWVGPGDVGDPDSWLSTYYSLSPPSVPGSRRVVNIRYECYQSTRYGYKPQVSGEAVTLPDP